jgi:hypothetical protein
MNQQTTPPSQAGPEALALSLLETLKDEFASLCRLRGHFDDHILALRGREKKGIDEATHRTNDEINILAGLKHQRDRKMRLLGRVLRIESAQQTIEELARRLNAEEPTAEVGAEIRRLRRNIRAEAVRTSNRCRDLEYALEYAVHLGRDLLHVLQGVSPAGATRVYTPGGGTIDASRTTSFVNRVG